MPTTSGKPMAVKTLRGAASRSEEWSRINMLGFAERATTWFEFKGRRGRRLFARERL